MTLKGAGSRPTERVGAWVLGVGLLAWAIVVAGPPVSAQDADRRPPLDLARVLAARYPAAPIMSYIPALSWSGAIRLSRLTGDPQFASKARREMQPFLAGEKPAIAAPHQLTSLAGHFAFADLAAIDGDRTAADLARTGADFILPDPAASAATASGAAAMATIVRFPRQWTDDMFMASSLLSRVGALTGDARYGTAVGRLLLAYAAALQRPDGLFMHAAEGPHAWGRGNGFALFGLADALQYLPASWPDRPRVLEVYTRHLAALRAHQAEDGMWRQVVDEPTSYKEFTVTAMAVAAMARGVRLGWIPRGEYEPVVDRGWRALVTRIGADGAVADVCSGTGAGPTKEYYLNRPAVSGGDDRGGAMGLIAALEMAELRGTQASAPEAGASLQRLLDTALAGFPGRAGIWVKHLTRGVEAGVAADATFNSASVIKLPVLVLAYRMAEQGLLSLDERLTIRKEDVRGGSGIFRHHDPGLQPTLRDVLLQMVITSDNTATDLAIARVGGVARVNAWLRERGFGDSTRLTQTTGELFAKYGALTPADNRNEKTNADRGYWLGEMTPRATGRLLEAMHDHTLTSKASGEEMLRMLRAQQAGARRLPHFLDVPVAHKTGDFPPVLANDVGIVFARSGPIVVSFFANAITGPYAEAEDRMGRITQLVVQHFDGVR